MAAIFPKYIQDLIAEGEHQRLDFKFEISDSRKIARTFVAFANTDGGTLLVGVKDNGAIAGVRSDEEYYMLEGASTLYCRPPVPFQFKKWTVLGKTVLEIIIEKSPMKPHFAQSDEGKWLAYIRVNDQNLLANSILLRVWKRKENLKGTFIQYSQKEQLLLDYLVDNPCITFGKYCRLAHISSRTAENILVNLISFDIIEMQFTEKNVFYLLKHNSNLK
jgi:predicted HTH transcriptional regulator